jgi:hypothetical protein
VDWINYISTSIARGVRESYGFREPFRAALLRCALAILGLGVRRNSAAPTIDTTPCHGADTAGRRTTLCGRIPVNRLLLRLGRCGLAIVFDDASRGRRRVDTTPRQHLDTSPAPRHLAGDVPLLGRSALAIVYTSPPRPPHHLSLPLSFSPPSLLPSTFPSIFPPPLTIPSTFHRLQATAGQQ